MSDWVVGWVSGLVVGWVGVWLGWVCGWGCGWVGGWLGRMGGDGWVGIAEEGEGMCLQACSGGASKLTLSVKGLVRPRFWVC